MQPLCVKIVVLGDWECGKTCLLYKFCEGTFPTFLEDYNAYKVTSFKTVFNNQPIDLIFTENESSELDPVKYAGADVILACYSVENHTSLQNITTRWFPEIMKVWPRKRTRPPVVLVGTMLDVLDFKADVLRGQTVEEQNGNKVQDDSWAHNTVICNQDSPSQGGKEELKNITKQPEPKFRVNPPSSDLWSVNSLCGSLDSLLGSERLDEESDENHDRNDSMERQPFYSPKDSQSGSLHVIDEAEFLDSGNLLSERYEEQPGPSESVPVPTSLKNNSCLLIVKEKTSAPMQGNLNAMDERVDAMGHAEGYSRSKMETSTEGDEHLNMDGHGDQEGTSLNLQVIPANRQKASNRFENNTTSSFEQLINHKRSILTEEGDSEAADGFPEPSCKTCSQNRDDRQAVILSPILGVKKIQKEVPVNDYPTPASFTIPEAPLLPCKFKTEEAKLKVKSETSPIVRSYRKPLIPKVAYNGTVSELEGHDVSVKIGAAGFVTCSALTGRNVQGLLQKTMQLGSNYARTKKRPCIIL